MITRGSMRFFLAGLVLLGSFRAGAQIEAGRVFGVNLSTMPVRINGVNYKTNTAFGIHFGGAINIPLEKNFTLQAKLLFTAKGSDYDLDTAQLSLSPIYLELPVYIVCHAGSENIRISLLAGPYFSCGIGGYKLESTGELFNLRYGSGTECDLKRFDIGFNLGAGVSFRSFMISAQYGFGVLNLYPLETPDSEISNQVVGISLCSLFASKK